MSSTALVLRITDQRTPVGRAALSMLLFEDIALVPIIFLLGAMGRGDAAQDSSAILQTLWLGFIAIVGLLILGRVALPGLFALAATRQEAQYIAASIQTELPDPDLEVWVTKFIAHGIHLAESDH